MDLSIPEYLLRGPGCVLLVLEFLFPPYKAGLADGSVLHLGRSLSVWSPAVNRASSVTIDWWALSWECFVLALCLGASYWLLSRAAPLWARE